MKKIKIIEKKDIIPGKPNQSSAGRDEEQSHDANDQENIESLVAFGFDRHNATRTYIECGKNKDVAANLLLDA